MGVVSPLKGLVRRQVDVLEVVVSGCHLSLVWGWTTAPRGLGKPEAAWGKKRNYHIAIALITIIKINTDIHRKIGLRALTQPTC